MSSIRVVVVDDHIVFREGVRALLSRADDFEVVGEAGTTDEAMAAVDATLPDVVLMDLQLPGGGGEQATLGIVSAHPQVAVLVLTTYSDDAHLGGVMAAGARGYLLKDADPEAILRSIRAVHGGQAIFDPAVASRVMAAAGRTAERAFPTLTEREHDILDRIARGLHNDAIAARMGISVKTVQNNVSSILLKLGVADRSQAVALARDAGLGSSR